MRIKPLPTLLTAALVAGSLWTPAALARGPSNKTFRRPVPHHMLPGNHLNRRSHRTTNHGAGAHLRRAKAEAYWHQTHGPRPSASRFVPPNLSRLIRIPGRKPNGTGPKQPPASGQNMDLSRFLNSPEQYARWIRQRR